MRDLITLLIGLPCIGLFMLVFSVGGIYAIYQSIKTRQQVKQIQNWPSTMGRVIDSRVVHGGYDTDKMRRNYVQHVEYEYTVGGVTYRNDQIAPGPRQAHPRRYQARNAANRYPIGATVTVFYNPANPQEAVLEQGTAATTVILIIGIALLGAAACLGCPLIGSLTLNLLKLIQQ